MIALYSQRAAEPPHRRLPSPLFSPTKKKRPGTPGRSARTSSMMDYGLVRKVNAYALRIELIGV